MKKNYINRVEMMTSQLQLALQKIGDHALASVPTDH